MIDNITISVDELSDTLSNMLNTYNRETTDAVKSETKKAMDKLVEQTKATAPTGHRRHKHYKNSITSRKVYENTFGNGFEWYVKGSDYRLSHLLENGHQTRNGGRVEGTHFIKNATNEIVNEYLHNVEGVLRNG